MDKTKANFRALREILGYAQGDLAEVCGVATHSVKRWERPDYEQNNPPDDAWGYLLSELDELLGCANQSVDSIIKAVKSEQLETPVKLAYFRKQEDLDVFLQSSGNKGRDYRFENAIARIIAVMLYNSKIPFEFVYQSESIDHGSNILLAGEVFERVSDLDNYRNTH